MHLLFLLFQKHLTKNKWVKGKVLYKLILKLKTIKIVFVDGFY